MEYSCVCSFYGWLLLLSMFLNLYLLPIAVFLFCRRVLLHRMDSPHFVYTFVSGRLGLFQSLSNKNAVNICVSNVSYAFLLLSRYLGVELLGFYLSKKLLNSLFFNVVVLFYTPARNGWEF